MKDDTLSPDWEMPEIVFLIHLRNNMFFYNYVNNKKILQSDILPKNKVQHLFTTRESVVTAKDAAELEQKCKENLIDIADFLSVNPDDIIVPQQTHSSNIETAKKNKSYPDTDALILEDSDIAILLNFADCTPVILYDEKNNIGAIAHAGWRGTASAIVPKVVKQLHQNYDTQTEDIIAVIGPAISLKNYQVNIDVFEKVKNTLTKEYDDFFEYDKLHEKYNIDLKSVNGHQLEELGVKRIDKCNYCTYDAVDIFFSYRRENGKTARHSAILKLN